MAGKVTYSIVADDEKAKRQVEQFFYKMERSSDQANRKVGKLTQQFGKLGKDLKGYAMGAGIFGGIAAGAKTALAVVRTMNQELERAQQLSEQHTSASAKLIQLADSPQQAQRLLQQVTKTRLEQGVSHQQAGEFVFQAHSAGVADKRKQLAQLIPITSQGGAGQVAQGVGGLQAAFGEGKGGGVMSMAGKIMSAAKYSPAGAGKMGKYAPRVAGFAAPIGATDEETLAALARTAKPIGGIEEAHTAVKAFARQLGKKGVSEGGLIGNVKRIQEMGLGPQRLSEYLGSSEAVQGYRQMRNVLPKIQQDVTRLQGVEQRAGTAQGYVQQRLNILPPEMQAQLEKRRAQAAEEISVRRRYGTQQTRREKALSAAQARMTRKHGLMTSALAKKGLGLVSWMEGPAGAEPGSMIRGAEPAVERTAQTSSTALQGTQYGIALKLFQSIFQEEQQKTREATEKQTEAIKENTEATRERAAEPGERTPPAGVEPGSN